MFRLISSNESIVRIRPKTPEIVLVFKMAILVTRVPESLLIGKKFQSPKIFVFEQLQVETVIAQGCLQTCGLR